MRVRFWKVWPIVWMPLLFMTWHIDANGANQAREVERRLNVHPASARAAAPTADPVGRLIEKIKAGSVGLASEGQSGYLRSLLAALDISISSQIAVFSKGSVQGSRISAQNPRTLFFNDSVAVGWVRGGFIELASQDPQQGVVFYTAQSSGLGAGPLRLERRQQDCLRCHQSGRTLGIPGMRVGVDHRTPLERRWGGWYVTGQTGAVNHYGNVDLNQLSAVASPFNWSSLQGKLDLTGYLTPYSDVVALLVFEHQMHLMNLFTHLGWAARAKTSTHDEARNGVFSADDIAEIADYILFIDEAPLASPVRGTSGFAEAFTALGPKDHKGRSLRQLDLVTRLMRYPCSYMIYTDQFEGLPSAARMAIYDRLWAILSGNESAPKYRRLRLADRRAIVEILRDTKPNLPAYFSPAGVHGV